jgi:NAD(P)-dependent dehydrogenase (short-subunit alcohol dehydrogenase family)
VKAEGIALVTGSSRGLGRAVALELAARGFEVVATMRCPDDGSDLPTLAAARGGQLRVERLDVTDPKSSALPDGLRVLVNNAAIEARYLPVEHQPLSAWREVFETNLFGLVEVTRRAIPKLRASGGGVVCNVTTASLQAPMPFFAAYRASKAAVSALGETLWSELAPFGIRVVEVLVGPVDTDMLTASDRMPEAAAYEEYRDQAERAYLGRKTVAGNVTPAGTAAASIAEVILGSDTALRYGCDPLGRSLLENRRRLGSEELMKTLLPAFMPD